MASQLTTQLGLNKFGPSGGLADDGYKFALKDRELIDALLWTLLNHDHQEVYAAALQGPAITTPPDLTVNDNSGVLPAGRSYFYKFAYLDANGNETAASTSGQADTEPPIAAPGVQVLTSADTGGVLGAGTYRYALAFYESSGGVTTAPNISTFTVTSVTGTNTITIPLPTKPDGISGWKIYRKAPGDLEYYLLTTLSTGTTYVDTGLVAPDCTKKRPLSNDTNSRNRVVIAIPASELPLDGRVRSWRVYRTETAGLYTFNSLVATITETTTEGGTDLITSYTDVGSALSQGTPLSQNATPPPIPQLDAAEIFAAASKRLPAALAPLGVRQFYSFLPGTLAVKDYNQVLLPHDINVERIDAYYGTAPTGLVQGVAAQGTLTMDTQPSNGDTMTVDTKTYTFQTTLTNVDGNVQIGASLALTQANIVAAFDLSGVAGTDYAAAMTAHTSVDMADFATNASVLTAKAKGTAGNSIATTETFTAVTNIFDAVTLGTTTAGVAEVSVTLRLQDDSLVDEIQSIYTDAVTQNEFQKIYNTATSGTFTLSYDGQGPTAAIAYNATAATIKSELQLLSNITEVSVTGSGTLNDPWIIEFVNPGDQNVAQITSVDTLLVGGTTTISTTVAGSDGGTFTLSDGTDTTSAIAYDALAATIETRLETDITSITNVTVTGAGTFADPWLVTFVNPGDQDVELLVGDATLLNGFTYIVETQKGRGIQTVDLVMDQNQAYHFMQTPTDDYGEQEAEASPATGGLLVSDTLAGNDAAAELDTQSEKNSWNIGTGLGAGVYTFRFFIAAATAEAALRVLDDGATIGSLAVIPARTTYDDPIYEIELTLDGTEDLTVEVEKTDTGIDVVRVDKYEYELQLPVLYGGQTMTIEVLVTGTPTTNGDDLQVTLWY